MDYHTHAVDDRGSARPRGVCCPACAQFAPWQGNPHRPFCSLTCRLRDLGEWLDERYRVPSEGVADVS